MGNTLCGARSRSQGASIPPKDTVGFLNAILDQESHDQENRIPFYWEDDFRKFLTENKQSTVINSLNFCLEVLRIQNMISEEEHTDSNKILQDLRARRLERMQEIGHIYLSVQSKQCITMTNQVLMEELGSELRNLTLDKMEIANKELLAARSDSRVWKSGLDLQYGKYLSTKPTQKLQAVLLSIL